MLGRLYTDLFSTLQIVGYAPLNYSKCNSENERDFVSSQVDSACKTHRNADGHFVSLIIMVYCYTASTIAD